MRTKTINLYQYSELSDKAKEKAREWYRRASEGDNFWSECVIEDAKEIGALFGLDIENVYWSGFCSQGDGACVTGRYSWKKGGLQSVKSYAGTDTELHGIVSAFQEASRKTFYQLSEKIVHRGHYSHERSMLVDSDDLRECLADFSRWIYRNLEKEYDYQNSDETIEEAIIANEYEFTEDGERA